LKHGDVTEKIIRCFYTVYDAPGYGYLESVYERAMVLELEAVGLEVKSQAPVQVTYRGQTAGDFRADLVVASKVIVEPKAARTLEPAFDAQLMNCLKGTNIEVGLLLNFGPKAEFKRIVFDNTRKHHP
jgi:GxxExxY protein